MHGYRWLLSVCHVVLVVADWTIDVGLLQLLRTARMLSQRPPSLQTGGSPPEKVLVVNITLLLRDPLMSAWLCIPLRRPFTATWWRGWRTAG